MSGRLPAGAVMALTREECRLLAFAAPEIVAKHRRAGIESTALRAVLAEIHVAALDNGRPADSAVSAADSLPILAVTGKTGESGGSGWVSTRSAAERLGMSQRGVVNLLHGGRIVGRQRDTNSAWRVSVQSIEDYLLTRSTRRTDHHDRHDQPTGDGTRT